MKVVPAWNEKIAAVSFATAQETMADGIKHARLITASRFPPWMEPVGQRI